MNNKIRGFEVLPEHKDLVASIAGSEDAFIPQRSTEGSAGYDIRSIEDVTIKNGDVALVSTGLTAYMQKDEELQIRCRSGFAVKKVIVANSPGTIDSDYYGKHIKVIVFNLSGEDFTITAGDRIGQGVFSKYLTTDNDSPANSDRTGGFGSTGVR